MFIKRADDSTARFAEVAVFKNDTVSRLTKRAASELQWGVDAGHIELFFVRRDSEDEPTSEEEAAALNGPRLGATVSLERAGIVDGICLLAKVTAPASKLGANKITHTLRRGILSPCCLTFNLSCCLLYCSCEQQQQRRVRGDRVVRVAR